MGYTGLILSAIFLPVTLFCAELQNIQRGSFTFGDTETEHDVTVSNYNQAQSFMLFSVRGGDATPRSSVRGQKISGTTLRFDRNSTAGTDQTVFWELLEFDSDVAVQDVTRTDFGTVAISAVDLSQSFIIHGGMLIVFGNTWTVNYYSQVRFNSTTEIEFRKDGGGIVGSNPPLMAAQVVDFTGCSVQDVLTTWSLSGTSEAATISSVDVGKTWVLSSMENGAVNTFDDDFWRTTLTNPTTLTFDRSASGTGESVAMRTYVITFSDGTTVQAAQHTLANTDLTDTISITVNPSVSTVSIGGGHLGNTSKTANNDDDLTDVSLTVDLAATTLTLTRSAAQGALDIFYQIISFNQSAAQPVMGTRRRVL